MNLILLPRRRRSGWTPASLGASLEAWYDASVLVGLANNDPVATWSDSGANGRTITYGASKPTYVSNTIDGKAAIRFGGSISQPTVTGTLFSGSTGVSAVYVFKTETAGNGAVLNQSAGSMATHEPWSDGNCYLSFGTNSRKTVAGLPVITNNVRLAAITAGATWVYRMDGTQYTSVPSVFANPATNHFGIGWSFANSHFHGLIAEVILANASLPIEDVQRLEGYLAHKWGLAANLPADHPYKSVRP